MTVSCSTGVGGGSRLPLEIVAFLAHSHPTKMAPGCDIRVFWKPIKRIKRSNNKSYLQLFQSGEKCSVARILKHFIKTYVL